VPLSEDEQKILHQIEQQFLEHDPVLAGELENTTLWRHALNRMKWAAFTFVLGVVGLVLALATAASFWVAFIGFVVMLVATLWFERNARRLGRAGWQHVTSANPRGGLRDYLGGTQQHLRERFKHDD
jgi:hypothetical protein